MLYAQQATCSTKNMDTVYGRSSRQESRSKISEILILAEFLADDDVCSVCFANPAAIRCFQCGTSQIVCYISVIEIAMQLSLFTTERHGLRIILNPVNHVRLWMKIEW